MILVAERRKRYANRLCDIILSKLYSSKDIMDEFKPPTIDVENSAKTATELCKAIELCKTVRSLKLAAMGSEARDCAIITCHGTIKNRLKDLDVSEESEE